MEATLTGKPASAGPAASTCRHSQLQKLELDYGLYLHPQSALQSASAASAARGTNDDWRRRLLTPLTPLLTDQY